MTCSIDGEFNCENFTKPKQIPNGYVNDTVDPGMILLKVRKIFTVVENDSHLLSYRVKNATKEKV